MSIKLTDKLITEAYEAVIARLFKSSKRQLLSDQSLLEYICERSDAGARVRIEIKKPVYLEGFITCFREHPILRVSINFGLNGNENLPTLEGKKLISEIRRICEIGIGE